MYTTFDKNSHGGGRDVLEDGFYLAWWLFRNHGDSVAYSIWYPRENVQFPIWLRYAKKEHQTAPIVDGGVHEKLLCSFDIFIVIKNSSTCIIRIFWIFLAWFYLTVCCSVSHVTRNIDGSCLIRWKLSRWDILCRYDFMRGELRLYKSAQKRQ